MSKKLNLFVKEHSSSATSVVVRTPSSRKQQFKIAAIVAAVLTTAGLTATFAAQSFARSNANSNSANAVLANADTTIESSARLIDETVYVFTRADGSVRKILSSDWTKNFELDEYSLVQNDSKKTPVDMQVTYLLDGNEISASDLAGKSGRVTIRFAYTNKEMSSGYYVPYAVLSGLVLSNDNFSNIEATNAKIINDGARTIVAGIALPGMQENLSLGSSSIDLPSYIEFSADAKDFKLDMAFSLVTNEVFQDLDVSAINSLDQLETQLKKMTDAFDQLVGGSSELAQGIETLHEKASALPAGVEKLHDGSLALSNGAATLDAGIKQLQTSVKTKLAAGATKIVGEKYANSTAIAEGVDALAAKFIDSTLTQYNPAFAPLFPLFQNFNLPAETLTRANYSATLAAWIEAMDNATISATLAAFGQDATVLKTQFTTLKTSLEQIDTLAASTKAYTSGVNQLAAGLNGDLLDGIAELKSGSEKLAAGASELSDGVATLNDSAPALVSGISQLHDGSTKLSSGLKQFGDEAIQKLVDFYNGDVKSLTSRIQDIAYVARNNSKNTKYIYRMDAVKK